MGTEAYDENIIGRIVDFYGLDKCHRDRLEKIILKKSDILNNPQCLEKYVDDMANVFRNLQKIGEPPKKNPIKNTYRGAGRTGKIRNRYSSRPYGRKPLPEDF